jgi:acyl dehydratase
MTPEKPCGKLVLALAPVVAGDTLSVRIDLAGTAPSEK